MRTKLLATYTKLNAYRVLLCTLVKVNDPGTPEGQSTNPALKAIMSLQ